MTLNYAAINEKRRMARATTLSARINDEARIANELQTATGCTRTSALVAAKAALDRCRITASVAALPEVIGRHGVCLVIRCTIDASFIEHWSDHVQGRDRCDELNRGLDHPAYFIA